MPCSGGIELKSPKIRVRDPDWRSQVRATWTFIQNNYQVARNILCSTHVHISMTRQFDAIGEVGMGLPNMKKVAQAIIHFEPALEALVPPVRRGNLFAQSNWIDNINFSDEKITREVAIEMIGKCSSENELICLLCPQPQQRFFAWNFRAMKRYRTIEFRKGSASMNADEVLAWAELVLLFVQAAVKTTPKALRIIPANVRGLKGFLGLDKLKPLAVLLDGRTGEEGVQPTLLCYRSLEEETMLQQKLADDEKQRVKLARESKSVDPSPLDVLG